MDAETILRIKPTLTQFLHEFDGCMGRITNRRHLETYVAGQLSDLQRKSIEPIADAAGMPPRTLQEFLGLLRWDEAAVRDRLPRPLHTLHTLRTLRTLRPFNLANALPPLPPRERVRVTASPPLPLGEGQGEGHTLK